MLGVEALTHATPQQVAPGAIVLEFGPDSALFHDGVARQLATLETIVTAALGVPTKVTVKGPEAVPATAERKSKRLTAEDARNLRLTQLRSKDPALDAAANALDLELVDDD